MPAVTKSKYIVMAGLDDVPHFTDEKKQEMLEGYPAHERDARSKGIPVLGSGRIFTYDEKEISYKPFVMPAYFARLNGIDFGWDHPTAVAFGYYDRDNDIIYISDVFKRRTALPEIVAAAIKQRGDWVPVAWPHDGEQTSKDTGQALAKKYQDLGVKMLKHKATNPPKNNEKEGTGGNSVEASLIDMQSRFETGRLKIAEHLEDFWFEYRLYHRKEGKIVKENDDVISACLHPDSIVITSEGKKRIQDMVGTNGKVLTINGEWADYSNCQLTRKGAELVKVTFSDGYVLRCTPDHELLTESGEWVQAKDAEGLIIHNAKDKQCKSKFITRAESTQSLATTTEQPIGSYTELFTKTILAAFQKAFTFIIRMATPKIMTFQTLSASTEGGICQNITKDTSGTRGSGYEKRNESGVKAKLEKNFSAKWVRKMSIFCGKLKTIIAKSAGRLLKPWLVKINSALIIAGRSTGANQALTTFRQIVRFAAVRLPKINIQKLGTVASHAVEKIGYQQKQESNTLRILRVESAGVSDVYCMAVDDTEAFAVENGAIVHNCRYLCMMIRHAKIKPKDDDMPIMSGGSGYYL